MTVARVIAAAAIVAALGLRAEALILCQQKGGQVVARDACKKKETPVDLAALGPLGPEGPPGTPGAAGAPGAFPVRLVDAEGVEVGTILQFVPTGALVEVSRPILGAQRVVFTTEPTGFAHNTAGAIANVFYASSDCSGTPLIKEQSGAVFAQVYGDSAYFSTEPEISRSFGSSESDEEGGPCNGGAVATARGTCCLTTSGMQSLQAAVRVALSALGLTPPFRAEPR